MRQFRQDVVYTVRLLRKSPGFALIAVLSLAIGIGANSAMFSFADALILRPLPAPRPGELVVVNTTSKSTPFGPLSWRDYADVRDAEKSVSELAAYQTSSFGLSTARDQVPQLVYGLLVSGNFFRVMHVSLALGRDFRPEEDSRTAAEPVLVVSHSFWKERLGADPAALGRRVRLNGYEFTIIGVAPESFTGMDQYFQPAMYLPLHTARLAMPSAPADLLEDRGNQWLNCIGRLAPGASIENAKAEFAALGTRLAHAYPKTNAKRSLVIEEELKARFHRDSLDAMFALMLVGIAGLVLLIACANLANLMLARSAARAREIAIRLAIGAGRIRLIRQLLTESLVLAGAGGAAGLLVAYWCIRALSLIKLPTDMPIVLAVHMDGRVILFSIASTLVTGLLFGLAPAIRATRADLSGCLRGGAQPAPTHARRFSFRNALVVAQVAVALAVLTSAGLLINSFIASQHLQVGFRTNRILMMTLDPSLIRMDASQGATFYRELTSRIRALPGVDGAAITRNVPLGFSGSSTGVVVDGYEMASDQQNIQIASDTVGLDYFDTLNISLVRGRAFDKRDTSEAPRVAIVNETMARRFWPNGDAVGSQFHLDGRSGAPVIVVGIAKDVRYRSTYERRQSHLYLPFAQDYQARMTLFVLAKPGIEAAPLASAVRDQVRSLNADVPIFDVRSFREFYDDRVLMPPRLLSNIVSALGVVGLALAIIGLYGVIAYAVSRRTKELGIRIAIGAERAQVARLVLSEGLCLSLTGVALGLPLAFVLSRAMSALTVDRTGRPEPILIGVSCVLVIVSVLAAWIPARRAAKIDPIVALRYD